MSKTKIENRLAQIRKASGIGASDLARRVNVSRQTIYAIETGTYVPNTKLVDSTGTPSLANFSQVLDTALKNTK